MATQGERRAETRERLLAAAAELFAERGRRGRRRSTPSPSGPTAPRAPSTTTSAARTGLLFALLEGWTDAAAEVIGAEVAAATTLDERLGRHLAQRRRRRRPGDGPLDPARARAVVLRRPRRRPPATTWPGATARPGPASTRPLADWAERGGPSRRRHRRPAPPMIGVLLGLEMMRRIDPDAIDTETAVAALRGAVGAARTEAAAHR